MLICAYGALIKEPLLSDHEMLNVHPSLLPRWRGAAPIERAIEAGDEETGVTIMRPIAELDAGPDRGPARRGDPPGRRLRLALRAARGARRRAARARRSTRSPPFRDQPDTGVTYAEKIGPEDRLLDPRADRRPARAPRARASAAHRRLRGAAVGRAPGRHCAPPLAAEDGPAAGRARRRATAGCCTAPPAARSSSARCIRPGKRPMDAEAWIRGYGDRLGG